MSACTGRWRHSPGAVAICGRSSARYPGCCSPLLDRGPTERHVETPADRTSASSPRWTFRGTSSRCSTAPVDEPGLSFDHHTCEENHGIDPAIVRAKRKTTCRLDGREWHPVVAREPG